MIVITGATGQLGGAVVDHLLARLPADQLAVSVRNPGKARPLAERGVVVRRGDFDDPASLRTAFADAEQLLLVSAATTGEDALRQHRAAVEAARAAGVGRVVYTSHMAASPTSAFAPMRDHAATEDLLAESGVPFTALRNGFYAASASMLLSQGLATGRLAAPADGPVSWTTHADLAEAAATVLVEGGGDGPTPALTGSEALDLADLATLAAELTGRPVTRTLVTDAEHRDSLVGHGVPAPAADLLLGLFAASRQGEFAEVDPALERLLGRPPVRVREHLASQLGAGARSAA